MNELLVFAGVFAVLLLAPRIIPYLCIIYVFCLGLVGRSSIDLIKLSLGNANIYVNDLFYLVSVFYFFVYFIKVFLNSSYRIRYLLRVKIMVMLILAYVAVFFSKLVVGYFDGLKFDSLLRMFSKDTQVIFFFLPLIIYNKERNQTRYLKSLLKFTIILSLVFPIFQPALIDSDITANIQKGQGTFRLGFGDGNILLGLGVIGIFSWEYKRYLASLPLAGILMLAHRSGYIAIVLALVNIAQVKGKNLRVIVSIGAVGGVVMLVMLALQYYANTNILERNITRVEETFQETSTTKARVDAIFVVFEEFQNNPIVGLSYMGRQNYSKNSSLNPRYFSVIHPHNFFLSSIIRSGIVGTVILLYMILLSLITSYKIIQNRKIKTQGIFLFSAIMFFVVYSTMNTSMTTLGYVFWFLSGTAFLLCNRRDYFSHADKQ